MQRGAASEQPTLVRPAASSNGAAPRLADGVELIGEYKGSGFKQTPYLARRADGQVVQLPQLLYLIAERADGVHTPDQIADEVSTAFGRGLAADDVEFLVDEKLEPLGLIDGANAASEERPKLDPMLALKFRVALVPESVVNGIARIFRPLFFPPVVVAVLGGLVALDVWLFGIHGVAQGVRDILYQPILLLLLLALVAVSAAFHECGHATACAYGGARPGTMGAGIYLVWPAFYTDVTDAYRLGKGGRLRTDLGGVYFNVVFILATAGAYFATGYEPLLLVIPIQHLEILHQFLPFLRLDGYYIVSDLTGVPDMFTRIKPTLKSLIPFREPDPRVQELKTWARAAVTAYVLTVVPLLLLMFCLMVMATPRIFATAWASFLVQLHKARIDFGHGHEISGIVSAIQMAVLTLPLAGIVLMFARTGKRAGTAAWTFTEERPAARAMLVASGTGVVAAAALVWWPNGGYHAIRRGDRGTVQGGLSALAHPRFHWLRTTRRTPAETPTVATQTAPSPGAATATAPSPTHASATVPTSSAGAPTTAPHPTSTNPSTGAVDTTPTPTATLSTAVPTESTPHASTLPAETTPGVVPTTEAGPTASAPTETTSTDTAATETIPTDTTPTQTTPTDTSSTGTTPTDTTSADVAPTETSGSTDTTPTTTSPTP